MKKIILMVVAMVMTVGIAEVSAASSKEKKVTIETTIFQTDIDCEHCVQKVMNYMPYQKGVKEVTVDLPKKQITVSYDLSKTTEAKVIKSFSKIDVTAEKFDPNAPVKATTTSSHDHAGHSHN